MLAGTISWWDDPEIVVVNNGIRMPHVNITIVRHAVMSFRAGLNRYVLKGCPEFAAAGYDVARASNVFSLSNLSIAAPTSQGVIDTLLSQPYAIG